MTNILTPQELRPKKLWKTHGLTKHPLFKVWQLMRRRCNDPNTKEYKYYGGKGVYICAEWNTGFKPFYDWCIVNGWQKGLQIDKDLKGTGLLYSPETCLFVTPKQNCRKRTSNRIITYNNISLSVVEWAEKTGLNYHTIHSRLKANWNIDDLFRDKKQGVKRISLTGEELIINL